MLIFVFKGFMSITSSLVPELEQPYNRNFQILRNRKQDIERYARTSLLDISDSRSVDFQYLCQFFLCNATFFSVVGDIKAQLPILRNKFYIHILHP